MKLLEGSATSVQSSFKAALGDQSGTSLELFPGMRE